MEHLLKRSYLQSLAEASMKLANDSENKLYEHAYTELYFDLMRLDALIAKYELHCSRVQVNPKPWPPHKLP
jgi:hypothetical protein